MPQSQRDVRNRISSVANIQKITRAMEMVAAARLRRAEQRIAALRPYASGRRGASSLTFRGREPRGAYVGFSERPAYADARSIASDLTSAYLDEHVDRLEVIYNGYVSPLVQEVRREVLLPLSAATLLG